MSKSKASPKPVAVPSRPGGNWPSKSGNVSGGGRGNAQPKGK